MLEFMTLSGHAKCAGAMLAALSLAERLAISMLDEAPQSFANWDALISYARDTKIKSRSGEPVPAFQYLGTEGPGRRKYRRRVKRNSLSPRVALGELIQSIAGHYFRDGSALHKIMRSSLDVKSSEVLLFGFLHRVAYPTTDEERNFYVDIIGGLEENEDDNGERMLVEFIKICFEEFGAIPHIDFPSIPLLCIDAIQCEFLGVLSEDSQNHRHPSLFAVIREARGWTTEQSSRNYVNAIVRDIVWIKNPDKAATIDGESDGFYFSAIDEYFYDASITRDKTNNETRPNTLVSADMSEAGKANHFYMFFPLVTQRASLLVEDGVIAGTAGVAGLIASWKVLLIQPDWAFSKRLETMLFILFERGDFGGIARLLHSCGACAQISNENMADVAEQVATRDAFRQLLFVSGTPPSIERAFGIRTKTSLTRSFQQILSDAAAEIMEGRSDPDEMVTKVAEKLIRAIEREITSQWHLIEPAQIITFLDESGMARASMRPGERRKLIATLLNSLPSVAPSAAVTSKDP